MILPCHRRKSMSHPTLSRGGEESRSEALFKPPRERERRTAAREEDDDDGDG